MRPIFRESNGVLQPYHLKEMLDAPKSQIMVMTALIEQPRIFYGVMGLTTYQAMLKSFIAGSGTLDFAGSLYGGSPLTLNCNERTGIKGYEPSSAADHRIFEALLGMLDTLGLGIKDLNPSGTSKT